jgi:hypothetical protein
MNNPLMTRIRRAYALLGTAAIVLGGAVLAYSTEEPTAKAAPNQKTDVPKVAPRVQEKVQYKNYPGAPAPHFPKADAVPDVLQRPVPAPVSPAVAATVAAGQGTKRVEKLLDRIERAGRQERLRRWMEISELTRADPAVAKNLKAVATGDSPAANRYVRFIAAANTAGFGRPFTAGPVNLQNGMTLETFATTYNMMHDPEKTPLLGLDPSLKNLNAIVPPNADNSLHFQEILWTILEKYHLDFRTEKDGSFMIVPEKPEK